MSDYLVYWKSYWSDVTVVTDVVDDWNMKDANFHKHLNSDDMLWVVIPAGEGHQGEWRLLMKLCVKDTDQKPSPHGPYHVIGNSERSELFDPNTTQDFTSTLRSLEFSSGNKITLEGNAIGKQLQAKRRLTDFDVSILSDYSRGLHRVR